MSVELSERGRLLVTERVLEAMKRSVRGHRQRVTSRRKSASRLGIESLECRCLLAADPIISEFMASNAGTLTDGDGASSDWIELFNRGDESID
ncbi:MAG: hypothetical protein KDA60_19055, partial [Planctomycetales bacterium]|nr:hypothetical protein [Planctomycetales bacterium]